MLTSLFDSQEAILEWALNSTTALTSVKGREVIKTITSHTFWWELKELIKILKPLHIARKESEAQNSSIMEVAQRWLALYESFQILATQTSFKDDFIFYLEGSSWQSRILRQLEPLHWVAYYLNPARAGERLDHTIRNYIEGILCLFEDENSSAWYEFLAFRQRIGVFYNNSCWKAKTPSLFWLEAVGLSFKFISYYYYNNCLYFYRLNLLLYLLPSLVVCITLLLIQQQLREHFCR
jgi:hypothetical protein